MAVYSFVKDPVDIDSLFSEISDANLSSAECQYVNYTSPSLDVYFDTDLSQVDQTTLSGVVSAHEGTAAQTDENCFAVADGEGGVKFINVYDVAPTISGGLDSFISNYFSYISGDAANNIVNATLSGITSNIAFGSCYHYAEEEDATSTNYNDYLMKVNLDTTTVPSGTYRIGWYYEWKRDRTSSDFMATVTVDDTAIMEHNEETKDKNDWHIESGFKHTSLTAGTHNVKLKYCGEVAGNATSFIRRTRIEFWRMS